MYKIEVNDNKIQVMEMKEYGKELQEAIFD
jgi:hypothetical protein